MQENRFAKLSVKRHNEPSVFKVDLLALAREKEELKRQEEEKKNLLEKGKKKIKVFLKKEGEAGNEQAEDEAGLFNDEYEEEKIFFNDEYDRIEEHVLKTRNSFWRNFFIFRWLRNLYEAIGNFFGFVQRVFYQVGWVSVFISRFVFFLFVAILKIFKKPFVWLSGNKQAKQIWQEPAVQQKPVFHSFLDPASVAFELEEDGGPDSDEGQEDSYWGQKESLNKPESGFKNAVQNNYTALNSSIEEGEKRENKSSGHVFAPGLKFSYLKTTLFFAGFLFVLILPFKALTYFCILKNLGGRVLGASEEAIGDLKSAGSAANEMNFYEAGEQFAKASDNFIKAQEEVESISNELKIISAVVPNDKLRLAADADKLLEAGAVSSKIGQQISFLFDTFSSGGDKSIKNIFNSFSQNIGPLKENTKELSMILNEIDATKLPSEYQEPFKLLQDKSGQISQSFDELSDLIGRLRKILGFEGEKRYLLIYENNSEMRASGGFMGSYSVVDFRDGEIVKMETPKGGTYDTEGAFHERIVAPEPLHIVNPLWHFWDANWWPDWKKTARKLSWFYGKSGGSSVDGVIAMTPVVVERFLKIIGPLDMEQTHGVTITAENFWEVTQTFAEEKPVNHPDYYPLPFVPKATSSIATSTKDIGKEPKKIIGDLAEKIKTELPGRLNKQMFLELLSSFEQSLAEKHVMFYFDDWTLQEKFEELGWAGRIKKTAWDYLMVVNTNISGAKSDRKIKQEISHTAEVQDDGTIVNTLLIRRTHTGAKGEKFSGVKNLDWMRIYLPLGSEFISAQGFWPPDESLFEKPDPSWEHDPDLKDSEENFVRDRVSWTKIYNEDDKTVFANWAQVNPGETTEISIRYKLPFKLDPKSHQEQPYALLVEKQPGAMASSFRSELKLAPGLTPGWSYPQDLGLNQNGWLVQKDLSEDAYFATILK